MTADRGPAVASQLDADLMGEAVRVVGEALLDLRALGHPAGDVARILGELRREAAGPGLPDELVPRFIPNQPERCSATTVLNCSASDHELDLPAGFAMEVSARRGDRFALPYYPDPGMGRLAADSFADRSDWTYGLSFIGQRGPGDARFPLEPLTDPRTTRFHFLRRFTSEFLPEAGVRVRFQVNSLWSAIHWQGRWPDRFRLEGAGHREAGRRRRYVEAMAGSRYVLCPRGVGANSIRFFETLALGNIPIYIGDRDTRLPLDWIIDWKRACFRISCEEVVSGAYRARLRGILDTPIEEVNRRRRYIFDVHRQFLAPERRPLLDQLVLLRARALLAARARGPAAPLRDRAPSFGPSARAAALRPVRGACELLEMDASRWRVRWARRSPSGLPGTLPRCGGFVTGVALGELDGEAVIATAHEDGTARLWDAGSGRAIRALASHDESIVSIAAGKAGGELLVATAGNDGLARVWSAGGDGAVVLEGHHGPVGCVALGTLDGRPVVASGGSDLTVRLWDARTGAVLATMQGHGAAVWGVALGRVDGRAVVASASDDRTARLWDAREGRELHRLTGHQDLVGGVAIGEIDGRPVIATASDDRTARLWDARSGRPLRTLAGHGSLVRSIALGALDGRPVVVTGGGNGTIRTWDAGTGRTLRTAGSRRAVRGLVLGALDGRPVIVSADGDARVWDARTMGPPRGGRGGVASVALGDVDGRPVVATAEYDGPARLWYARDGRPRRVLTTAGAVRNVAMGTADGAPVVVTAGDDGCLRLWDARDGRGLRELDGDPQALGLAMAGPHGHEVLAMVGGDGAVRVLDVRSGRLLRTLETPETFATSAAACVMDGAVVIATACNDGSVRLWSMGGGRPWCVAEPRGAPVVGVALGCLGGRAVVAATEDEGRVHLLDARGGRALAAFRGRGAVLDAAFGDAGLVLAGDHGIAFVESAGAFPS